MTRSVACLAIALVAAALANAQDARLAADLRQHNTALLRARHLDRALVARDAVVGSGSAHTDRLLTVCQQTQATTLFVVTRALTTNAKDVVTAYRWRALLSGAHRLGMRVYAVCGDAGTVSDYGVLLDTVDELMRFGTVGLPGEQFDGLLLDLPVLSTLGNASNPPAGSAVPFGNAADPADPEPDPRLRADTGTALAVPAALTSANELVRHLSLTNRVRSHLSTRYPGRSFELGVCIPAWLDTQVVYRGATKPARDVFVDLCDFLVVHNLPYNTTDVAQAAEPLLSYAGSMRRPVLLRLEVRPALYDLPSLLSLFSRDQLFAEQTIQDMLARTAGQPGLGGFVIDDWVHWTAMPPVREAAPPVAPVAPVDLDAPRQRPAREVGSPTAR